MPQTDIFTRIGKFFSAIWQSLLEALLFLGSPKDIAFAFVDVIVLSFIFYFILKLLRDSRAWQLLKGILLIMALGLISDLVGLTALGFLLSRTISIFAIAFVVIFQPELRRALETVGRSGFKMISSEDAYETSHTHQIIESIVRACSEMAEKRTGALIVIERSTPLGDLEEQENAIVVDAAITTTMLKQIFYVGSPLHDGAVLIRGGRVAAARVHIPLSDNYHLRRDLGTRHRAAIGASEIGDTVAIVVSEERGTISICLEGRLYMLDNEDALRTQLHRLLLPQEEGNKKRLPMIHLRKTGVQIIQTHKQRVTLMTLSLLLALGFWFYVQTTVNPVRSQNYQVQLTYLNQEELEKRNLTAQYRIETIRVTLRGREQTLSHLNNLDISAYIDLAKVEKEGLQRLPVEIRTSSQRYTKADSVSPAQVLISVRPEN